MSAASSSQAYSEENLYGVLAEYSGPHALLRAAHQVREAGYTATDAFAPYPLEGLPEAIGQRGSVLPWVFLIGGISGGVGIYALQYWINIFAYPINIGGRPLHSWPSFILPTFECTILLSSLAGFLGLLALCGLPRLHHPLFEITRFHRASADAFFLCVESRDRHFDPEATREFLLRCGATEVWDVPQTR